MAVPASLQARTAQRRLSVTRALPGHVVMAGLVAIATGLRIALAVAHRTPRYFPDEYVYATLARSIAHGQLTIRGTPAHFPALLEPLLASPFALVAGVETAFRLTQGLHAVASSLAAVPVYLLARRLGLPTWQCVASGLYALALPELVYSSYITADAVALPLALAAVYFGVTALEKPTAGAQLLFLGAAGLATFARIQYVVLPVAFVLGAIVVERGRLRQLVTTYRTTLVLVALPIAVAVALGPSRVLGFYSTGVVTSLHRSPLTVAHWFATDSFLIAYTAGWVLLPAALVGLTLGLIRPRSRSQLAVAGLVAPFAALMLLETAFYASNGADRFQERYLLALPPLLPVLFGSGMSVMSGRRARLATALLGAGGLLLTGALPLSGYAEALGKQDSPFLQAVSVVEDHLGKASGALVFAAAAGVLALVAAAAAWRPRVCTGLALALAILFVGLTSVAAARYDVDRSARAMRTYFPEDARWVDHAGLRNVAVLQTPGAPRGTISGTLFWNTSVTRILKLRGSDDVDTFGSAATSVRHDGVIVADGRPYRGPLLMEEYSDYAQLDDATLVERNISTSLWRPNPGATPRLAMLARGRYLDGWLAWTTNVTVWPSDAGRRDGALCMTLDMPRGVHATLDLRAPNLRRTIVLGSGATKRIALPVRASVPWRLTLKARRPIFLADDRLVSVRSSPPRFVEGKASAATCR